MGWIKSGNRTFTAEEFDARARRERAACKHDERDQRLAANQPSHGRLLRELHQELGRGIAHRCKIDSGNADATIGVAQEPAVG